jgi:hypothetical protein
MILQLRSGSKCILLQSDRGYEPKSNAIAGSEIRPAPLGRFDIGSTLHALLRLQ